MEKWFEFSTENILAILISAVLIYVAIAFLTRISGKRSFSKMSSFDFAVTVSIGSIMATAIVSKSVSLQNGIVALTIVYGIQLTVAYARRFKIIRQIMDNKPTLLMKDGKIIEGSLEKCKVTRSDLKAKLREANVLQISEVKAVVFETTGDISVLHSSDDEPIDDWILDL